MIFSNSSEGAFVLQICSLSIIFNVLEQTVNGALQGIGKIMTPAIALIIGVTVKFILNIVLVQNPKIGASGAAFATATCHAIAFCIGFKVLQKNIDINLKFFKFIVKPAVATIAMAICSYGAFLFICGITSEKLATIISILIAVFIYLITITVLKIFSKEEILMLPMRR